MGRVLRLTGTPPSGSVGGSAIDPLELPLGDLDRALDVLAAGAVIREHVHDQEVGDRGCGLLARRTNAGRRQRPLAGEAEHLVLGITGPYRVGVIGVEAMGEI